MRKKKVLARIVICTLSMLLILGSFSGLGRAQVTTTGRISGIVMDQRGAVIRNAEIVVKNNDTGAEYTSKSGEEGTFFISSLQASTYTVTVTAQGFKQTKVTDVKIEVGQSATVEVKLEVGAASESVTVTGGAEVLLRDTTNIGSIISGRQITELPFASRDALDLVLTLPGTSTPGRPRSSSINGLPKGALFISLDGINAQDNFLRTSDAFFTYIRPRVDAIAEVEVSTSTPGAEASAGGAIHIRFVTKGGSNEYHGGAYWYNRQRAYNANWYFNNLTGTERAQVMLNQFGGKAGGPITPWLKDRAWFFVNYEEYRLPEQTVRTRTILSPDAQAGIFKYPGGPAAGVNLLSLAASAGLTGTFDPTISKLLGEIRSSTAAGSVRAANDPNLQSFIFTNTGGQKRRFPTLRFDFNVTSKHHVEAIYNFQDFASKVDFLNGVDPAFPSPVPQIFGSQASNRFSLSTALRSQLTSTVVNEARFGLTGGTVVFFPEVAPGAFDVWGGASLIFPLTLSNPRSLDSNQRRNSPVQQFNDNLSWTRGKHNYNFGAAYNRATSFFQSSGGPLVPQASFNVVSADPADAIFSAANFPGSDLVQRNNARAIYALLTGRVSSFGFFGKLDETTKTYSLTGSAVERNSVHGYGFYFQDYYKFRPNLSLNYGLRWEAALSPRHNNGVYVRPTGLYGISGEGNLFKPGFTPGVATTYVQVDKNTKAFEDDRNNWAPSVGIAWSPNFKSGLLKTIFGENDKSVFRTAYAISYVVGGFADYNGVWTGNPGLTRNISLQAGTTNSATSFIAGSRLLRNGVPAFTAPAAPTFPLAGSANIQARDFNPNLKVPYVQSWNFGIQREITKDTVFEARYVGNHSIGLGRSYNLNETNIFENGFLQEFIAAQKNLAISIAAGAGSNFRNQGLPGQVALPIFQASFLSPTSTSFANATFVSLLQQGQAGSLANQLSNLSTSTTFQANRVLAGLPANLFIANPTLIGTNPNGGAILATNSGSSTYSALQVELRRRFSQGLTMNANYTWSHALTNQFTASGALQPHTLRNVGMDKGPSPWDVRHAFKLSYTYDLPFGAGHKLDYKGPGNVVGKLLEGWASDGIIRYTSGRVFGAPTSGRATFNQFDAGINLVGISIQELQSLVKIRKDPAAATRGTVFWLPDDIIQNTLKAFGLVAGAPSGRYLAPPTTPGQLGTYFFLYGPNFFRADLSVVKKTRITERANVEFRVEFLNAFNNINFLIGNAFAGDIANADLNTVTVNTLNFGQTSHAYRDLSTTNDPGGRLIQLVLRVNF
ncbi:MAG: TonB-dependent receptor [Acidobacteriota bacterium]